MPQKPEAIKQDMEQTRDALTDKINLLEEKVVETVHEATAGVKQTVEAVKDAVEETVQTVKDSVGDTVDSVKESFSLTSQIQKRPWTVMAGATAAGFAAGYLLSAPHSAPATQQSAMGRTPRRHGNGHHKESFAGAMGESQAKSQSKPQAAGAFDNLSHAFEKEIDQLKGLAIGTLAGVVRDLVMRVVPEVVKSPLGDIMNDLTVKLGGEPIRGPILSEEWRGEKGSQGAANYPGSFAHQRQTTM